MGILKMDSRRRITLPKTVIDDPEIEYIAIKTEDGILLKPISKDPLKELQEEGKKIPSHLTIKNLKKIAEEEAYKEIENDLRRIGFLPSLDKKH